MIRKLFAFILIAAILAAQAPRIVLTCVCTGEIQFGLAKQTQMCDKHAEPHCKRCPPKASATPCFVSTSSDLPQSAVLGLGSSSFDLGEWIPAQTASIPSVERGQTSSVNASWVQPRSREPDIGNHAMRAPPILA